jgi:hypothetical protein
MTMTGFGGFGPRGHGPDHAGAPPTGDEIQFGTTGADTLTADGVHTVVAGLAGDDSIAGSAIDERGHPDRRAWPGCPDGRRRQ